MNWSVLGSLVLNPFTLSFIKNLDLSGRFLLLLGLEMWPSQVR